MAKVDIAGKVTELLETYLADKGLDVYQVEYKKEGPGWVLRVYLDKAWTGAAAGDAESEYVGIDECEAVAGWLSDRLDELDLIERSYNLEVSSPGLDRELLKPSDYVRFAGRAVEIRLYEAVDGSKYYEGTLIGKDGNDVVVDVDGTERRFAADRVSKINLAVVF